VSRPQSTPRESGHAPVNGIQIYYEIHGDTSGVPLVLLHGGGSTIQSTFGQVLPLLARHRTVIALEEQAHGRTTDRDRPVRFDSSADDVIGLLEHLRIAQVDLWGFSNGASVALHVTLQRPDMVRRLVFASSMTRRSGAYPYLWEAIRQAGFNDMPQALKDAFLEVNPDPQKLRTMHDKDAERMRSFEDVPDELVRTIEAPTLLLAGDQDIVTLEHVIGLTHLIPGARVLIVPGGHGDYMGTAEASQPGNPYPPLTAALVEAFLDASS
jgi:pimeloyl-ACP methyl ester carboxylesterase